MLLTILLIALAFLLLTSLVVILRTVIYRRRHVPIAKIEGIAVDPQSVAEHLASAVRCKTVPLDENGTPDPAAFQQLHDFLRQTYPHVHANMSCEVVNGCSLLYRWEGSRPELSPVQFMAHQDVVSANEAEWTYPPFAGSIAEGMVWGRGTLDIKNQVIGILEAAEELLKQGYQPERSIYIAFGHDEETGGEHGAACIAAMHKERGVTLSGIVDEGGGIFSGQLPYLNKPIALIGIGEKGYLTIKLTAKTQTGHSSAPPKETSIGILSHALARLEDHPLPPNIRFARPMFWALGPVVPIYRQIMLANIWLFGWLIQRELDISDETRAYIRTSQALTVFHAGTEDNTLPDEATAYVNFRMLPRSSVEDVLKHVQRVVHDERVNITPVPGKANRAVGPSPVKNQAYAGLSRAIRQIYGDVPEAPFVMLGGTDCGHYTEVCDAIYRFTPLEMDPSFLGREHGIDERIPVAEMAKTVKFYAQLMKTWGTESMD